MSFDKKINDFGGEIEKLNTTLYTQTKRIVRKLYKLKLIDLDTKIEEKNCRKKKFYSLTELGVYYIMKRTIFLKINIQSIIKNLPNLKIFEDLLYPFIKKDTLCSSNFPKSILGQIPSYIQKKYLKIENFFLDTENKTDWKEKRLILNKKKLQNYLIENYKYKYKWLETAETEQNDDDTIIKFFNIDQPSEYLEVRLREEWVLIYLKDGTKKKIIKKIQNIKQFQIEKSFSKEEGIDREFSTYYRSTYFEFISSILPALDIFNFETTMLFLKDKNFVQSLDKTKEEFDKIYKSIKNPSKYSRESIIKSELYRNLY